MTASQHRRFFATLAARRAWKRGLRTLAVFAVAFPDECTQDFDGICRCRFAK